MRRHTRIAPSTKATELQFFLLIINSFFLNEHNNLQYDFVQFLEIENCGKFLKHNFQFLTYILVFRGDTLLISLL